MAWITRSEGVFKLHDSDNYCGALLSLTDAAEIMAVNPAVLQPLASEDEEGVLRVNELDLHRSWGRGEISSPHPQRVGNARRSFDELVLKRLIELTYPQGNVEIQVPFGRKRADLVVEQAGSKLVVEFMGPSHFIQQYNRVLNPLARKKEVEQILGYECVVWPYWIQQCSRNVQALFEEDVIGLASVWSTRAHFGDFKIPKAAETIVQISQRFNAFRDNGIGYMYLDEHTAKPVHPIIERIQRGKVTGEKLIPPDNQRDRSFWLPRGLYEDSIR